MRLSGRKGSRASSRSKGRERVKEEGEEMAGSAKRSKVFTEKELQRLLDRRDALKGDILSLERQIYDLETNYLEDTEPFKNALTGWTAPPPPSLSLSLLSPPSSAGASAASHSQSSVGSFSKGATPSGKKTVPLGEDDRIFSLSSLTSPASIAKNKREKLERGNSGKGGGKSDPSPSSQPPSSSSLSLSQEDAQEEKSMGNEEPQGERGAQETPHTNQETSKEEEREKSYNAKGQVEKTGAIGIGEQVEGEKQEPEGERESREETVETEEPAGEVNLTASMGKDKGKDRETMRIERETREEETKESNREEQHKGPEGDSSLSS